MQGSRGRVRWCMMRAIRLFRAVNSWRAPASLTFSQRNRSRIFLARLEAPAYRPDPDKVRARLHKILSQARAARTLPWDSSRASLYRTIFPQMTLFLPEQEAAQLRFEFESEMARLEAS